MELALNRLIPMLVSSDYLFFLVEVNETTQRIKQPFPFGGLDHSIDEFVSNMYVFQDDKVNKVVTYKKEKGLNCRSTRKTPYPTLQHLI